MVIMRYANQVQLDWVYMAPDCRHAPDEIHIRYLTEEDSGQGETRTM